MGSYIENEYGAPPGVFGPPELRGAQSRYFELF